MWSTWMHLQNAQGLNVSLHVRTMHAALLGKEIKTSIPQKAGPVPPRAMPGAEPQPAEEESSAPEADRPISRGSAASSARKASLNRRPFR